MVGVSKAGFGAGAGILAVPLMAVAIGAENMLPVLLPVLICGDIFALLHYTHKKDRSWRNLSILIPSCLAGIALGMLVLEWFIQLAHSETILNRTVGVICIVFSSMQAYNYVRRKNGRQADKNYKPAVWHGAGMGCIAGITSTLAHSAGPLIALFILPQRLPRRMFVGTCVFYFFIGNIIKLIPYTYAGLFSSTTLTTSFLLFPCAIVGTVIGSQLNKNINDFYFNLAVYTVTFASGVYLLV